MLKVTSWDAANIISDAYCKASENTRCYWIETKRPHNRKELRKKSAHTRKIHNKIHTLSSIRGRGIRYLYFKQMREKQIIEVLVSLPRRMLGDRVHSSLLRRRLGSTQEFPRDGVARGAEGPPWRCGGPCKEGGVWEAREDRSEGAGGREENGGPDCEAGLVETQGLERIPGRYLPLRSQEPERIQGPGEKAAPATAESCPGDAWAGATHRACAVPPSGRAPRGSQAAPASGVTNARLPLPSPSASQGSFPRRFPPSHQLSTPFSVHHFLKS